MLGASQVVVVGYFHTDTGETLCASCAGKFREARTRNVDTPAWSKIIQYEADEANSEGACDDEEAGDDPHGYGYVCDECGHGLEE
jgi:predicted nucleic acid-binding Zn ribbon protein